MVQWTYAHPQWWYLIDSGCHRPEPDGYWCLTEIADAIADAYDDDSVPRRIMSLETNLAAVTEDDWILTEVTPLVGPPWTSLARRET